MASRRKATEAKTEPKELPKFPPLVEAQFETFTGDHRENCANLCRTHEFWTKLTEKEQRWFAEGFERIGRDTVVRLAQQMASLGLPQMEVRCGKFSGDGENINLTITVPTKPENIEHVANMTGGRAVLSLASPEIFFGERRKFQPDNIGDLKMPREKKPETAGEQAARETAAAAGEHVDPATGEIKRPDELNLANVGRGDGAETPAASAH